MIPDDDGDDDDDDDDDVDDDDDDDVTPWCSNRIKHDKLKSPVYK